MVGGIDQQFRKPKQMRGTPAHRYANIAAAGLSVLFGLSGVALYYSPGAKRLGNWLFDEEEMERNRAEREQRAKIMHDSMIGGKSATDIRKSLRLHKKYYSEGRE